MNSAFLRKVWVTILVVMMAFAISSSLSISSAQTTCNDGSPRIAVMSAFDAELALLRKDTANSVSCTINGVEFTTGTLVGHDAVLLLSGGSMINASMNTQLLFDHFNVTHLIFSGIAGGVDPSLNVGDVAVPEQWAQYQEMLYAREVANADGTSTFTPPSFFQKTLENFGMMFPQPTNVRTNSSGPGGEFKTWFAVDPDMLAVAEKVSSEVTLSDCNSDKVCLTLAPRVVVGGNGVSGQTFVDNKAFREYAFKVFGARVLDMETAATATVAYVNRVPFLAFRSLSDLAGGGPGENEIMTFFGVAADNSALVLEKFLEEWEA